MITDGRGNVPLDDTAERRIQRRVGAEGIDDALTAAHNIAGLARVTTTVITPPLDQYPHLPDDLAAALGGKVTVVHRIAPHRGA